MISWMTLRHITEHSDENRKQIRPNCKVRQFLRKINLSNSGSLEGLGTKFDLMKAANRKNEILSPKFVKPCLKSVILNFTHSSSYLGTKLIQI